MKTPAVALTASLLLFNPLGDTSCFSRRVDARPDDPTPVKITRKGTTFTISRYIHGRSGISYKLDDESYEYIYNKAGYPATVEAGSEEYKVMYDVEGAVVRVERRDPGAKPQRLRNGNDDYVGDEAMDIGASMRSEAVTCEACGDGWTTVCGDGLTTLCDLRRGFRSVFGALAKSSLKTLCTNFLKACRRMSVSKVCAERCDGDAGDGAGGGGGDEGGRDESEGGDGGDGGDAGADGDEEDGSGSGGRDGDGYAGDSAGDDAGGGQDEGKGQGDSGGGGGGTAGQDEDADDNAGNDGGDGDDADAGADDSGGGDGVDPGDDGGGGGGGGDGGGDGDYGDDGDAGDAGDDDNDVYEDDDGNYGDHGGHGGVGGVDEGDGEDGGDDRGGNGADEIGDIPCLGCGINTICDGDACHCLDDFQGNPLISCYDPCDPNPCLNGGNCYVDEGGGHVCACGYGYGGMACATETTGLLAFYIEVEYLGAPSDWTAARKAIFATAATRWQRIILNQRCAFETDYFPGRLLISATLEYIDGPNRTLGEAGPTRAWTTCPLTSIAGGMRFDTADVELMEAEGNFGPVVLHEMGHVIGIGILWGDCSTCNTNLDANWKCPETIAVYNELLGNPGGTAANVLETNGGAGTVCGHFSEQIFGDELSTGMINTNIANVYAPLSKVTAASLDDTGYVVDASWVDEYSLPSMRAPAPTPAALVATNDDDRPRRAMKRVRVKSTLALIGEDGEVVGETPSVHIKLIRG